MTLIDILLMILILSGAGYLFYRSFYKKKGCSGCTDTTCPVKVMTSKKILIK